MSEGQYRTELSLPLLGRPASEALAAARAALDADARVLAVETVEQPTASTRPVEHVELSVRLAAGSEDAAKRVAGELHDGALRGLQEAAGQAGERSRFWTSSCSDSEPVAR